MKNLFSLSLLLLLFFHASAQDSLATIYFYRSANFAGALIGYKVRHDSRVVGKIKSGSAFIYYCKPGLQTFSATIDVDGFIKLEVKQGQTYFIECGIGPGGLIANPSFRQVSSLEARTDIMKINPNLAGQIKLEASEPLVATDTVRALQNLFHRKHHGGSFKAVFFGLWSVVSIAAAAASTNSSSAGYVTGAIFGVLAITGGSQTSKYSSANLDLLLNDYKGGNPLPSTIKGKLKKKDFR